MKKRFLSLVSLVLISAVSAAAFASCSCAPNKKSGNQSAASSQTSSKIISPDELVSTVRECFVPFKGNFFITGESRIDGESKCRMPQIKIDSDDVKNINEEIVRKYGKKFDRLENADADSPGYRIDYVCFVNGNILSLAIELRTADTPRSVFSVYNIDVYSGKALSKDEVASAANKKTDEVYQILRSEIKAQFSSISLDDDFEKSQKEKSLSDENMDSTMFYINGENRLVVAYTLYWIAGADKYGELLPLN